MDTTRARKMQLAARRNETAHGPAPDTGDPAQIAAYVADVTLEMRNLAKNANLTFLAYLLEMSFQEAFDLTRQREEAKN